MELIIETNEFEALVDTEDKNFKVDDIICGHQIGYYSPLKQEQLIEEGWNIIKIHNNKRAKFYKLVDNYYKVKQLKLKTKVNAN